MTPATVGSQIDQTLDRPLHYTTQVAFDHERAHLLTDTLELYVGQVLNLLGIFDTSGFADLARTRTTNTKDRGKSDFGVLMRRNIDASNTGHDFSLLNPLRCGD